MKFPRLIRSISVALIVLIVSNWFGRVSSPVSAGLQMKIGLFSFFRQFLVPNVTLNPARMARVARVAAAIAVEVAVAVAVVDIVEVVAAAEAAAAVDIVEAVAAAVTLRIPTE